MSASTHSMATADAAQASSMVRVHGGTDALGTAVHDFSTNSNACGPCPAALQAVQAADAGHYPDAHYTALVGALAALHAVQPWRVVLAGSASEFIFRITALASQQGARKVWLPSPAYGDYADAARAWNLAPVASTQDADLLWGCEPASPTGQTVLPWAIADMEAQPAVQEGWTILDCAYAPLRLRGSSVLKEAQRQLVWQLFSPNKALALTGVRAAYAIAPQQGGALAQRMQALAPSWPIGAHGVAMLQGWATPAVQDWVRSSLPRLQEYQRTLLDGLHRLGWQCMPSDTHYLCARPPVPLGDEALVRLRQQGIKLRDTTSMGLPGWFRLSAQAPQACQALFSALSSVQPKTQGD